MSRVRDLLTPNSLSRTQQNILRTDKMARIKFVFRRWVVTTWVLLLLLGYSLLTYTNTNATVWNRYSPKYALGLTVYFIFLLSWPLILFLRERTVWWWAKIAGRLNANSSTQAQFILTWVFFTLLTLTVIYLWDRDYNLFLWFNILVLGIWLSISPLYWMWSFQDYSLELISLDYLYNWFVKNLSVWLPLLVGAMVLIVSNYLGFQTVSRNLALLLGLLPGLGIILIFIRWPPIGLMALVVTSLIIPSPDLPGGLNIAVLLLIMLIGLPLLNMVMYRRSMYLLPSRTIWPILSLLLAVSLSFGIGQLPWFGFAHPAPLDAQFGGLMIFFLAGGAFLLTAYQIRDLRWLQWLTWIYIAIASFHVFGWLVPGVGEISGHLFQLGATNNSLFWVWLVTLTFSQALLNKSLHPGWRLVLGIITLTTLYVAFVKMSDWKSGYLPPLVSIAVIVALRSWRLGLIVVLVSPLAALYLSSQAVATDQYSYSTRIDALLIMVEIIKVNPIFGFGPANYYWYTPLFPIRGWAVNFNSHNQYVDIVAQTGLIGLACVIWFAVEIGGLGWRLRNQVPTGFAQAYVYGTMGGLAAMLASGILVDWFFPFVYNIGLTGFRMSMLNWVFLGGLVSIEQIYRHQAVSKSAYDTIVRSHSSTIEVGCTSN